MKSRALIIFCTMFVFSLCWPATAKADGIIIPDPPICEPFPCPRPFPLAQLVIRYHRVTVSIQDQVAITHVDQVFYNPNDWQMEGVYVFPVPLDAAISSFSLWVDGQPVEGEVLDAENARQIYEEIVRNSLDPALLEYADRGALRARIFPIPPRGERRIELEYSQVLAAENGLVRYLYPLNTEKFSLSPLEVASVSVEIRSRVPVRAVYSPSHPIAVSRESDNDVIVGYEETNVLPSADFALYYSIGETEAFHLLSYRDPADPNDPDGFFLLLLAPRPDTAVRAQPKDVILVLDRSGSMDGEKFRQAQQALRYILEHLNPEDRFNLITFSTGIERYADTLRPASEAAEALPWVQRLSAQGNTDINRALLEAAAITDRERPTYLIFLTDGLPTEGETDSQKILDNLAGAAFRNLRLFAFGVGYDVDTFLLDSLAQAHHGASTYVLPGERLDETLSAFYEKISTPVMTDLSLDFGEIFVYDVFPSPLPDLFTGSQIVIAGRYKQGGSGIIELTGTVDGLQQNFRFDDQSFAIESRETGSVLGAIPRLWATRKIGYLLNKVRLQGADQETIDQIVRLSVRYGIVTPYTSYLVTEEMPLGAAEQERIAREQYNQIQSAPAAPAFGEQAVEKALGMGALADADHASSTVEEAADVVRVVGARTFISSDGVWLDTAYDPQTIQTVKVPFLSDDYFALAASRSDLAAAFALGEKVIVISEGIAYEVVGTGVHAPPVDLPAAATPGPGLSQPQATPQPGNVSPPTDEQDRLGSPTNSPCIAGLMPVLLMAPAVLLTRRFRRNPS